MKDMLEVVELVSRLKNKFIEQLYGAPKVLLLSDNAYNEIMMLAGRDNLSTQSILDTQISQISGLSVEISPPFLSKRIGEIAVGGWVKSITSIDGNMFLIVQLDGEVLELFFEKRRPKLKWRNEATEEKK